MLPMLRLAASVLLLNTVSASPWLVARTNSSSSGGVSSSEGQWQHGGPPSSHSAIVNTTGNEPASSEQAQLLSVPVVPYGGSGGSAYHGPAWISSGHGLHPSLSQSQTNGGCELGTLNASKLPDFVHSGPMPGGKPWGDRTCKDTNQLDDTPNTGMTRHYDFTVSNMVIAPDGVEKNAVVINGQFPGPTIEANWGDWVEVVVHNHLEEGTAIHWHGLLQKDTPWMDGVPGVQQCPIAPGSTFTYRFRADLYGSTWYHSHYSAQYAGGAFGPLVIYGPHDNAEYDEDLGPVLIHDWFHKDWFSLVEQVMAPETEKLPPPPSNNVLINGKMNYPCSNATGYKCTPNAGVSKFNFESGKTYRLRVINSGAEAMMKFSIDGHEMSVIENDFVPIVPYTTDVLTLAVGQRSDILVKATGKPTDAVWMRADMGPSFFKGGCSIHDGVSPLGVAAIYYEDADTTAAPTTNSTVPESALTSCQNDPLSSTVPYYSLTPPANPETVQNVDITFQSNGTNKLFYMNNSTFRVNFNDPVLLKAKLGHSDYPASYNVYNFGQSKSIRMIVFNHAPTGAHPMHMHGHNMYILAEGYGSWDGTVVNPNNPQRRDVQVLPNSKSPDNPAYIVVQFDADNPGVWPFHCHIAWHVSGGLYLNILERPDDIQKDMAIPGVMAQTCRDWSTWTGQNVVKEIDSGL
ncbi:oxidoreductase ptaK [Fulvia fulva]|uniref:Oxidoreductase ptaK n=1 Tax=Passalora fulva TaxID=5499 RepID=A0A9Q8PA23_PASFU|nr:oxidoreductase ptaK [Fulvia fulva]KAK4621999.1 oxidoreductase ptaK [Fulvia fulva]KAK4623290.1 oxidoreductase ptaK [Fulvia fulva]UJO18649.1 oxidoreductase ptaK [Fulvia fulva]WPV15959.1 oxidoreductase ptaK [Fulvia fulva]WPV30670.1 oxidoreductase ptaK [Fulvia fulva]